MRELWRELRATAEPGEHPRDTLRLLADYYRRRARGLLTHVIGLHGPWLRCGVNPTDKFCTWCGQHMARELVKGARR